MSQSNETFEISPDELAAQTGREGNHPFALGEQAARDGQPLSTNPFPRRSGDALAFKRGWSSVIAEQAKSNGNGDSPPAEDAEPKSKYKTKARYAQPDLPGTEDGKPKFDEAVDLAARQYAEARDARMAAGKIEKERKDFLIELLQKKELPAYKFEDVEVEMVTGEVKLKVRNQRRFGRRRIKPKL